MSEEKKNFIVEMLERLDKKMKEKAENHCGCSKNNDGESECSKK